MQIRVSTQNHNKFEMDNRHIFRVNNTENNISSSSHCMECWQVCCCLSLLYCTMLADAMFYGMVPQGSTKALTMGPFALSLEQVTEASTAVWIL